jgi:hypothetical protein
MSNSVFGKTMENLRNRINVDLVRGLEADRCRKLIADPGFITRKIFHEELIAIHRVKATIKLNKPIYAGMTILDLSKVYMYTFYYDHLKPLYKDRMKLLYTDTDSLVIDVQTDDIYGDMLKHRDLYDTSDYPKDHPLYDTANKKVLGKFKDECRGVAISEFVGLRPKMYSIMTAKDEEIKKANGVVRAVVKKQLSHALYKKTLFEGVRMRHKMVQIKSKLHQMGLYRTSKISLSAIDTKRYIREDGVTTLAYGHYAISN